MFTMFIFAFTLSCIFALFGFVVGFQYLSRNKSLVRSRNFIVTTVIITIVVAVALKYMDQHGITNTTAPSGIVSFEFAWNSDQANMILRSWSPEDKIMVALSIGLDFLFMPLYATTIASIILFWNEDNMALASSSYAAAAFDVIETAMLAIILTSREDYSSYIPKLASWCACAKFMILSMASMYVLWATVVSMYRFFSKSKRR